jgi:hypothetical protein
VLFLVAGVEVKVVRHAGWIWCVVKHDEECGRASNASWNSRMLSCNQCLGGGGADPSPKVVV